MLQDEGPRGDPEEVPPSVLSEVASSSGSRLSQSLNPEMIPVGSTSSEVSQAHSLMMTIMMFLIGVRELFYGLPQPQSLGSFFQRSNNVNINGGQFISSQPHHTNLTINIGRSDASGSSESGTSSRETGPEERRDASRMQEGSQNNYHSDISGCSQGTNSHPRQESPTLTSVPPVQMASNIYYRHLAAKGRGSPLWIPEPNDMLPIEYQRKGIGIGDVGIITHSGGFDFLFNICLSESDPINPERMPLNFKPLAYPEPRDVYGNLEFKPGSYLASSLIETSRREIGQSPGLAFETSAKDGAVLVMPTGSRSTDVKNLAVFRQYAIQNVEAWYQYANGVRGREAGNGDLRLVIGYHSARAWGMAAFSHLSEQSARTVRLNFTRPASRNTAGTVESDNDSVESSSVGTQSAAYEWECSGPVVDAKSGPLLAGDGSAGLDNQALFIRTINLTLQDDVWNKLSAGWYMNLGSDNHTFCNLAEAPSSTRAQDRLGGLPMPLNGALNPTQTFEASGWETQSRRLPYDINADDEVTLNRPQGRDLTKQSSSRHGVHISCPSGALNLHPSTMINRYLLKERPSMRMAITEDKDWISVVDSDETVLPPSEILFSRIVSTHELCEDDGAIFFKPNDLAVVHAPSTPPPSRKNFLKPRLLKFERHVHSTPVIYQHRPGQLLSSILSAGIPQPDGSALVNITPGTQDLNDLADALSIRYNHSGKIEDLEESISLRLKALALRPHGHPRRAVSLKKLADTLIIRYNQLEKIEDLEKSISLRREALALRPHGHFDRAARAVSLNDLADGLSIHFKNLRKVEDLQESISLFREALTLRPHGYPYRAVSLKNLADTLTIRYNHLGKIEDLEESISLLHEGAALCLHGHPNRVVLIKKLAKTLNVRYNHSGDAKDLEDSISLHREVLSLRPPGHPHRAVSLNDLADTLNTRYKRLGNSKDLEEFISLRREVNDLYPPGHRQPLSDDYPPSPERSGSRPPSTPLLQPASHGVLELRRNGSFESA